MKNANVMEFVRQGRRVDSLPHQVSDLLAASATEEKYFGLCKKTTKILKDIRINYAHHSKWLFSIFTNKLINHYSLSPNGLLTQSP